MKYIAVFEVPDGYVMGCAMGKICPKDKEVRTDKDYENVYANVEPLSAEQEEAFDRYDAVERLIQDLVIHNAYSMPGFWTNNGSDYKVIETKYNKGYFQALDDIEREARKRFGFAERTDADRCHFECIEAMEKEERKEE